jgi:predicted  nucleic acid-binding Zn-ribbon protein
MAVMRMLVGVCASLSVISAVDQHDGVVAAANPIRKVVTMLQAMQKKVMTEGEKEKELYDKFACYCRNGAGELGKSISEAETKVPTLGSDISEAVAKKKQLKEDLKNHKSDRSAAKSAMASAVALREKSAAAYAKDNSMYTSSIAALSSAIAAVSKGMSGAFLQTNAAQVLKKLVLSQGSMLDADRQDIMSFLSGSQEGQYVPQSGDIVGILKGLKDEMTKNLGTATAAETASITSHDQLMSAKTKELDANTKAVETKTVRVGGLAVSIAQMETDLSDTEAGLADDQKFLSDLDANCAKQEKEWEERSATRSEELLAISETIKVLNDDDALEIFKKTLPSSSSSFMQMEASRYSTGRQALSVIRQTRDFSSSHRPQFDFIALAMQGKAAGWEKVKKMIDDLVATLKAEQSDDDHKVEYCHQQFDLSNDKKKSLAKTFSDLEVSISEATDGVATLKQEIESLEDAIKALDKSVSEATAQRQSEHEDFTGLMSSDAAAKELLRFAINRLNRFYKPSLHKATQSETVLAQISSHAQQRRDAPAPFEAYSKKKDESDGVIEMLDRLVKNLDKEMTEASTAEEDAQKDYEQMLKDAGEKRALSSKTLTNKNISKASLEADVEASKEAKASTGKELMATDKYVASLHASCDWLLQYYDVRKEARASEMDALANAKAVLSGADLPDVSFVQQRSKNLRRQSA